MTDPTPGRQQLSGYVVRDHDDAIAILRSEQIRRGPSQQALAARMHCSRTAIGDALAGRSGAGARQFVELVQALGYDLALIPAGGRVITYEEWRVTGDPGDGYPPYEFTWSPARHDNPEAEARGHVALLHDRAEVLGRRWTDGPHLHRRTVTVTEWEEA